MAIRHNGRTAGALASPRGNLPSLPDQFDRHLHLAVAARELLLIQEQVRGQVRVGSAQGIVYRTNQHTGLKNGGLCQREVAMVEGVEGIYPKLKGSPFGQV